MKTGPTNQSMGMLIYELRQSEYPIWKRVARELARARRQRRGVNLYHINNAVKIGEVALVPGIVLATGEVSKKLTVVAWKFTNAAAEKIKNAGGKAIKILDYFKTYKKGSKVRVIG